MNPTEIVGWSVGLSIVILGSILFVVYLLGRKNEKEPNHQPNYQIWDLIRESDDWPSLVRFQFLTWTLIVVFCFMTIAIARLLNGLPAITPDIPENLLILIGISAAVTPVSVYISGNKYKEETPEAQATSNVKLDNPTPLKSSAEIKSQNTEIKKQTADIIEERRKERGFGSMLLENDRPSLPRFQMFSWTIIGVLIYLGIFFAQLNKFVTAGATGSADLILILPDISFTLVALMGISQAAYIGGKYVSPKKPIVFPGVSPNPAIVGQKVTIKGVNFGTNKGTVRLGTTTISSETIDWTDAAITFTIPKLATLDSKGYPVTVIIGADAYTAPETLKITDTPKPTIEKAIASTDEKVTIAGKDFGNEQGQVLLDGKITDIVTWSDSLIVAKGPKLEPNKEYNVKLLIDSKFEVSDKSIPNFVLLSKPQIKEIPNQAAENTEIKIKGINFGKEMGQVTIDGNAVVVKDKDWADTSITFVMPKLEEGKEYEVAVVVAGVAYPSPKKIKLLSPIIGEIPEQASEGAEVLIKGENFGGTEDKVSVEGKFVKTKTWADNSISFVMPKLEEGKEYEVAVIIAGKSYPSPKKIKFLSPIIGEIPEQASEGDKVLIKGENFGGTKDKVSVDGKSVVVEDWKDTLITFVMPKLEAGKEYEVAVIVAGISYHSKTKIKV